MLSKYGLVKGDMVDWIGKKVLTVLLASLSVVAVVGSYSRTGEAGGIMLTAVISFSTAALAIVGDKVEIRWKCFPIIIYTTARLPVFLRCLPACTDIWGMFYAISMIILSIIIITKVLTIQDDGKGKIFPDYAADARLYLILLSLMDAMNSLHDILCTGDIVIASDYLSRMFLYCSSLILLLPAQGFLNIRRIAITFALFTSVDMFSFLALRLFLRRIAAIDIPTFFAIISATVISIITLVLCTESKAEPEIDTDTYDYSCSERMLKILGWCNSAEEQANRHKYLESAFKRNFSCEYARRFYCDLQFMEDIARIQRQLGDLQIQRNYLIDDTCSQDRIKASHLEEKGAQLLGKLSIVYNFNTGINECPKELLREGDQL